MSKLLPPHEPIQGIPKLNIGHFWSWAYSDILSNTIRPLIAEFLVGHALNLTNKPRVEWDSVDFYYGKFKIEVKSGGYIQTWHKKENKPSTITFDIEAKHVWNPKTRKRSPEPYRAANCYVFCVYTDKDLSEPEPLDVSRWEFYVMATSDIEKHFGSQKSVSLSHLKKFISPFPYEELKTKIDQCLTAES